MSLLHVCCARSHRKIIPLLSVVNLPSGLLLTAAVIWGSGEPLKVEEIQIEPPKSTEVRVRMLYASVCHTDVLRARRKGDPVVIQFT
jgi:S-(hydroxymethyl)glutathione dehydrogenase/alcohol dehydrogenase